MAVPGDLALLVGDREGRMAALPSTSEPRKHAINDGNL
jgi:hypothetical protein